MEGLCSQVVSVHGGLCSGGLCLGFSVQGVSIQEDLCPGVGLCPGGLCPREITVQGVSVRGSVRETPPHMVMLRAVCTLLECILVQNVSILPIHLCPLCCAEHAKCKWCTAQLQGHTQKRITFVYAPYVYWKMGSCVSECHTAMIPWQVMRYGVCIGEVLTLNQSTQMAITSSTVSPLLDSNTWDLNLQTVTKIPWRWRIV